MNCTPKEWDSCRVEKIGCDGCYYSVSKELDITDVPKNESKSYIKIKDKSVFD